MAKKESGTLDAARTFVDNSEELDATELLVGLAKISPTITAVHDKK